MRVFRRRSAPAVPPRTGYSIIAAGTTVLGDVEASGVLRVEGAINGSSVRADVVILGAGGVIAADVHTREAVIAGRIEGEMTAAERLELQSSAVVDGTVTTPVLVVHDGAVVRGTMRAGTAVAADESPEKERTPRLVAAGGDSR